MSQKELVMEAVRQMPEEASWEEIVQQLARLQNQRREKLKCLLQEGLQGEALELTNADWDEMRHRYDEEFPPVSQP